MLLLPDSIDQSVSIILALPHSLSCLRDSHLTLFCLLQVPFGKLARISCEVFKVRALTIDLHDSQLDTIKVIQLVEAGKIIQCLVSRSVDCVSLG